MQGGGLLRLEYALGFDRGLQEGDHELESHGVTVVVDPFSAPLQGAEVDFLNTITESGFKISNPNATSACGCGHSFQVEEGEELPEGTEVGGCAPAVRTSRSGATPLRLAVIVRRDEKVRLISRIPLFESCSQAERARFATILTQVDLPAGEELMREGEPGERFFVLVKGHAEVRKANRKIATLGAGDFAGEIALLTNAPRMATVRTTTPVIALEATHDGFSALLDTSPAIQRKLLKALADRLAPAAI